MSVTHLEVPFKISAMGYYVNTACGAYVINASPATMTSDRDQVTCHSCKRTRAVARQAS